MDMEQAAGYDLDRRRGHAYLAIVVILDNAYLAAGDTNGNNVDAAADRVQSNTFIKETKAQPGSYTSTYFFH